MAPAPARVAAVPLVGEPAHDRVTVPATDLPSYEFGQYPVQRSTAQVPEIRGVVARAMPGVRVMHPRILVGLDGFERRILRPPHRLVHLLNWVVQRRLGQALLLRGLRHRDRNRGRHGAQVGHPWQQTRASLRRV
jgi:hypothetical protein